MFTSESFKIKDILIKILKVILEGKPLISLVDKYDSYALGKQKENKAKLKSSLIYFYIRKIVNKCLYWSWILRKAATQKQLQTMVPRPACSHMQFCMWTD